MERKMFYELVAFCIQKNEGKYVNYYCDLKTENRPYYERVYKRYSIEIENEEVFSDEITIRLRTFSYPKIPYKFTENIDLDTALEMITSLDRKYPYLKIFITRMFEYYNVDPYGFLNCVSSLELMYESLYCKNYPYYLKK